MALFDDLSDGVKKVFLAGVGAVAIGAEKSQELVEELVRRGELTVEQGRSLNEELGRKVRETKESATDEVLRSTFRGMTPEERAAWIARAQKVADDLEVEDAEYEVTEEDVPAPVPDETDEPEVEAEAEPEPAEPEPAAAEEDEA